MKNLKQKIDAGVITLKHMTESRLTQLYHECTDWEDKNLVAEEMYFRPQVSAWRN